MTADSSHTLSARERRIQEYRVILTEAANSGGQQAVDEACRQLCLHDLFYLLAFAMNREDVRINDWLFDRCSDVQHDPDGRLDLWAREHYKSTIITFAKTIQDILADPELTICIFSHTKPIARAFLRQIKYELENNTLLKRLFDHLYDDPKKEAPAAGNAWSEDKGITVKRTSNPKEATLEAYGLVDGQPTSKHFALLVYDDVVTLESVSSPEMIEKTTDALALSYNLGAHGGRRRFVGTRYNFADTYREVMKRLTAIPRIFPATNDGTVHGKPVFLSVAANAEKRRDQGPYVYGCQMLQNPTSESQQSFDLEWLRYYTVEPDLHSLNVYIVVDPAHSKKKSSDFSVMLVIGLAEDRNYYLLDGLRRRLNLKERTDELIRLHREYTPQGVGYEQYGMQADIEHIEERMEFLGYRFAITPLGGNTSKVERIKRLQPKFEQGRIWLPRFLWQTDENGKRENIIQTFLDNEYVPFPVSVHDDFLDDMANILHPDMPASFPAVRRRERKESWRDRIMRGAHSNASAQAA
jgi:predicted phage terminase large subunit-like protein